jgi:hypothetical protein
MYKEIAFLSIIHLASGGTAQALPPGVPASGYQVLSPISGDNSTQINTALATGYPVLLTMGDYAVTHPIAVHTNNVLVCENYHDNTAGNFGGGGYGGEGTTRIIPSSGFSADGVIQLWGSDAAVRGCSVNMDINFSSGNCFQVEDGGFGAVLDNVGAFFCRNHGLDMTAVNNNIGLIRVTNHSSFFNSSGRAINLAFAANASTSDIHIDNSYFGSNCKGGCDGDIYLYGTNGAFRNNRQEWSNGTGLICVNCGPFLLGDNYWDRTGLAAVQVVGKGNVNIMGGQIMGASRGYNYAGPAVLISKDSNNNMPTVQSNVAISVWSANGSQYQSDGYNGGRIDTIGRTITPNWPYTYQDQLSHDMLNWAVVSPY